MKNERPDGKNVRDLLEAALAQSLGVQRTSLVAAPGPSAPPRVAVPATAPVADGSMQGSPLGGSQLGGSPLGGSPVVVGEVVDTHHPHLPGRVLVRWWPSADATHEQWLHHERHLSLVRGDRVLVTLPLGWSEWLVTGAIGRAASPGAERPSAPSAPNSSAPGSGPPSSGTPDPIAPDAAAPDASARKLVEGGSAARLQLEPGQALVVVGHDGEPLLQLRQAPEGLRLELVRDQLEIKARRRLRLSADSIEIAAGPGGVDVRTDGDAVTRARAIRLN